MQWQNMSKFFRLFWRGRTEYPLQEKKMTRILLERQIQEQVQRQFNDATAKRDANWHWGNVGDNVWRATEACQAILAFRFDETLDDYFLRVLPEMVALAERYRHNSADADGYGLGTVRELEEMLKVKVAEFGLQQRDGEK